ncbi:flagella basal body P-ring formation protein FlgA [Sphingomonas radiodurans]|uniref:flagella basal body P-ring formation protein FlgA n=1 Tax=Sphingomonas radiodurans TaxID=2890321 RepID=UPI001E4033E8|nr:flagella basal body P-ring formation protein FlgA [Sphingomonas radiodurans]WBH15656.1 flagella basal body P-ring formation protein FlgA [Sphingomonas radiodurans]
MIALALALAAAGHQDTAALDRAVAAFTGRAIGDEGGARAVVDPRLRLATCPMVAMSWRTEAHDAVVVACSGPDWRLFVPVRMPAQATVFARTPAAAPAVGAEKIIKRGDPLLIEAGSDGFSITREGIAMADAAQGQRLMVRVEGAKMPVQAVAMAPGRATLPGWAE